MSNEHERGGQQLFRVLAGRSQREGTVSGDLGNSGDCEHGAGRFIFLFFWADVRSGWAWNDSGAKSVGGQPMIRIASIQYGVGVDSDIWFDSNGLGLGNTHPGSWYKAHKTTLLFTRRKKSHKKSGIWGIGVFLDSYFGGDPFFLVFLLRGVSTPEGCAAGVLHLPFQPLTASGTPGRSGL
ncbi:uncharacterized protein CCOS01_16494 [Colletotrichum costaricense]|uniref:Uncharacterized protein n=2 Tax=Colletotrichum acutatum species complex TaxID=2707335 RepID=A0AAI9YFG1_9PEZI|nr:uncharacterized protein CCOS01_16494 [Colletotrichum costaricense]XP_060379777.1 uncharacterized protein CTAM01_09512 [Colletotrichum tamarilloi]KAK1493104.1 hypothetical protein CTAM01_09512 [Colletotrichum tamarilloi]KAK1506442.1 hypothetical protein CCOS01_16494 [Colletotrichum costaricense]